MLQPEAFRLSSRFDVNRYKFASFRMATAAWSATTALGATASPCAGTLLGGAAPSPRSCLRASRSTWFRGTQSNSRGPAGRFSCTQVCSLKRQNSGICYQINSERSLSIHYIHIQEGICFPDSIVNLNCIYDRKVGNPEWLTASSRKDYPTGEKT